MKTVRNVITAQQARELSSFEPLKLPSDELQNVFRRIRIHAQSGVKSITFGTIDLQRAGVLAKQLKEFGYSCEVMYTQNFRKAKINIYWENSK